MTGRGKKGHLRHGNVPPWALACAVGALVVAYGAIVLALNAAVPATPQAGGQDAAAQGSASGDEGTQPASGEAGGTTSQVGTSEEGEGDAQDPTSPLVVTAGRDHLDALGGDEASCVAAVVSFLGRQGVDADGLEVTVPLPYQTVPTSGERVIWLVVPTYGRAVSSQGTEGGTWSAGWISGQAAGELGIDLPAAEETQGGATTTYETLDGSGTLTQLLGDDATRALAQAWQAGARQNVPDVDASAAEADVDHVDAVSMTGRTQVVILDPASGRRFTATFDDPAGGVDFAEVTAGGDAS